MAGLGARWPPRGAAAAAGPSPPPRARSASSSPRAAAALPAGDLLSLYARARCGARDNGRGRAYPWSAWRRDGVDGVRRRRRRRRRRARGSWRAAAAIWSGSLAASSVKLLARWGEEEGNARVYRTRVIGPGPWQRPGPLTHCSRAGGTPGTYERRYFGSFPLCRVNTHWSRALPWPGTNEPIFRLPFENFEFPPDFKILTLWI